MTDRDTLAALIRPHLDGGTLSDHLVGGMAAGWQAEQIADAVLAAGEWTPSKGDGAPYMVVWSAHRFPWMTDEDGCPEPDPRQEHDMWFGPFPDLQAASAFAKTLRSTESHDGYEVGVMYPPDHKYAHIATNGASDDRPG